MVFNGSISAVLSINLTGSVAAGDAYVRDAIWQQVDPLKHMLIRSTIAMSWYNGDDAIALVKGTSIIDVIGG